MTNNFNVQSFQVSTQNLEENSKNNVYRVFSFAFKFEFVTFKPKLKWENVWNQSCRFWHEEQLWYSKLFKFSSKILSFPRSNLALSLFLSLSLSFPCSWPRPAEQSSNAAAATAASSLCPACYRLLHPGPAMRASPHTTTGHKSRTSARRRALDAAGHQCRWPATTPRPRPTSPQALSLSGEASPLPSPPLAPKKTRAEARLVAQNSPSYEDHQITPESALGVVLPIEKLWWVHNSDAFQAEYQQLWKAGLCVTDSANPSIVSHLE